MKSRDAIIKTYSNDAIKASIHNIIKTSNINA